MEMGRLSDQDRPLSRQMVMSSIRLGLRSASSPMSRVFRVMRYTARLVTSSRPYRSSSSPRAPSTVTRLSIFTTDMAR